MRFFLSCILAIGLLTLGSARSVSGHASPPQPGNYYLALGDSIAAGVGASGVPTDHTCSMASAPGYVCAFYRYLRRINPNIQLDNLAISGADSCVFVHGLGNGSPCTDPLLRGPVPSELGQAVAFLQAHPGQVSPITIDIGGDDLLQWLPAYVVHPTATQARLPAILQAYRQNLGTALSQLRAAAPGAEILVINQYNPLGGLPSILLPRNLGAISNQAVSGLNAADAAEAQRYQAIDVDVASAFNANPTGPVALTEVLPSVASGGPENLNIHPDPAGYAVYARTVMRASGYLAPLTLTARIKPAAVRRGRKVRVFGSTTPISTVKVVIHFRAAGGYHRVKKLPVGINIDGAFHRSFSVGSRAGRGFVRVCAREGASRLCSRKLHFRAR